jgi:hypothetical protein
MKVNGLSNQLIECMELFDNDSCPMFAAICAAAVNLKDEFFVAELSLQAANGEPSRRGFPRAARTASQPKRDAGYSFTHHTVAR